MRGKFRIFVEGAACRVHVRGKLGTVEGEFGAEGADPILKDAEWAKRLACWAISSVWAMEAKSKNISGQNQSCIICRLRGSHF